MKFKESYGLCADTGIVVLLLDWSKTDRSAKVAVSRELCDSDLVPGLELPSDSDARFFYGLPRPRLDENALFP